MNILTNISDPNVIENIGKIAVSRGPLFYCIESEENINQAVDVSSLSFEYSETASSEKTGRLTNKEDMLIPYFLWGNRGKKKMKIWITEKKQIKENK